MRQWVQHISGQGEKWVIRDIEGSFPDEWCVWAKSAEVKSKIHWLPKSEYRLCDPPEEWEDVTEHVIFDQSEPFGMGRLLMPDGGVLDRSNGRLRKVRCGKTAGVNNPDWAFIVERRKS